MILDDVPGTGHRITDIYVWLAATDDSDEGVIAMNGMPLVMSSLDLAERVAPYAAEAATQTNKVIKLVHFSHRSEIRTVEP